MMENRLEKGNDFSIEDITDYENIPDPGLKSFMEEFEPQFKLANITPIRTVVLAGCFTDSFLQKQGLRRADISKVVNFIKSEDIIEFETKPWGKKKIYYADNNMIRAVAALCWGMGKSSIGSVRDRIGGVSKTLTALGQHPLAELIYSPQVKEIGSADGLAVKQGSGEYSSSDDLEDVEKTVDEQSNLTLEDVIALVMDKTELIEAKQYTEERIDETVSKLFPDYDSISAERIPFWLARLLLFVESAYKHELRLFDPNFHLKLPTYVEIKNAWFYSKEKYFIRYSNLRNAADLYEAMVWGVKQRPDLAWGAPSDLINKT